MADEPIGAGGAPSPAPLPGLETTGNPIVDGTSRLLTFLERLLTPQSSLRGKRPHDMNDEELREVAFQVAMAFVDGLGLIVQTSFDDTAVDDPSWHRPWPTTVETFVRSMFMTAIDAFGTAAVGLGVNASVTATSDIRALAECHVLLRWVFDAETDDEQRGRVLAMTRTGIKRARKALERWERTATGPQESAMAAYVRQALDAAQGEFDSIVDRHKLTVPKRPEMASLLDQYLPGGYVTFAVASDIGAHRGPSPFFFYGESDPAAAHWDYRGLFVERAFWITQACKIQLENCKLAATVFPWFDQEHVAKRIADELGPVTAEAERRFTAKRDPRRIWI